MSDTTAQSAPPLTPQQRYDAALLALTAKQRAFVRAYLDCLNAAEAARRAKYPARSARQVGQENLTKPDIAEAVRLGMELQTMPSAEILARLAAQARADMSDFLRIDEEEVQVSWSVLDLRVDREGNPDLPGAVYDLAQQQLVKPTERVLKTAIVKRSVARLDLLAAGQAGKLGLIKKYAFDDDKVSIELYDAQAALRDLAKVAGLFKADQAEHVPEVDWDRVPDDIQIAFLERRMTLAQVVAYLAQQKEAD